MSANNWTLCPKCKKKDELREDYEFYMREDGFFTAGYHAMCMACDWEYTFNHKEQVDY